MHFTDYCTSLIVDATEIKIATAQLAADNTYSGIEIDGCTYSIFSNTHVSNSSNLVKFAKYGIEENSAVSTSDYNIFGVTSVSFYGTAGLRTTGAGSKYDSALIIGSIVTS
jgi:hypothetical protein